MLDHNITLPSKPRIVSENNFVGVFEIDNLYPGYGYTLGNSIRRILLSSLPGAAITQVKIKGVDHEFSTIPGMRDDVINIILNLKKVRFLISAGNSEVAKIKVKGDKVITAADIEVSGGLEVMNKDQYIAESTTKTADFEVEIVVEKGLGFVSREVHHKAKTEVGVIALDAIFSPVRSVSYEVEDMRVGDKTNFNRLRLNIQTDGSMLPREALESSVAIMIAQLQAVLDIKEEKSNISEALEVEEKVSEADESEVTEILKTRIENIDLSTRTMNALINANIRTLGGLARKRKDDLYVIDGLGDKGIKEIEEVLETFNLSIK